MSDEAGCLSRALFLWAQPMVRAGFSRPLQENDGVMLPRRLVPKVIHNEFSIAWQAELSSKSGQPSLLKILWRVLGGYLRLALIVQVGVVVTKFGCVMLLRRLVQIVSEGEDESRGQGIVVIVLLCFLSCTEGVLAANASYNYQLSLVGLSGCFAHSVLRKGMILHPDVQEGNKRGDLVNLALSDCNRLFEMSLITMQGLLAPLLLVIGFVLLSVILGPLVLSAFVISSAASVILHRLGKLSGASFRNKMKCQGNRIAVVNEFLQSVRFTKYYVLEEHYKSQVMHHRHLEMRHLRRQKLAGVLNWFTAAGVPCIITAFILSFYRLVHGGLPAPEDTFALIATVRFMYLPFAFFGDFLNAVNIILAATGRLRKLLMLPEVQPAPLLPICNSEDGAAVLINGQSFSWYSNPAQPVALASIDMQIPQGELWVVVGEIGSGKSSLISAVLGHVLATGSDSSSPAVQSSGPSRAYVSQEPMIMNATIKENIIFGTDDFKNNMQIAYEEALWDTALGPDLEIMPARDFTEIGEKGITLSGGQKARIALARAVFASKPGGLVLLDDPLAAVDAHVGAHIFEHCICKALKSTTRILVTNQLHFLANPAISHIIVMSHGSIAEQGTFEQLTTNTTSHLSRMASTLGGIEAWKSKRSESKDFVQRPLGNKEPADQKIPDPSAVLTDKEASREAAVTWTTMFFYVRQVNPCLFACAVIGCWFFHLGELLPDLFLAAWQDDIWAMTQDTFASLWLIILFSGWLILLLSRTSWIVIAEHAGKRIHTKMLERLLCCTTSFFDRTPSGQIMNRFGEDQSLVDWIAPMFLEVLFLVSFKGLDMLALPIIAYPQGAPIIGFVLVAFMLGREVHRRSNRETIRWWITSKSPLYSIFEEALTGVPTIFAFGREQYFFNRFEDALTLNLRWILSREASNHWANQRFCFIGAVVVATFAAFMLFTSSPVSTSFGTVAIIQTLMLGENFQWMSYFLVQVEGMFTSVERARQFTSLLEQEPPRFQPADKSLALDWPPVQSSLEFRSVSIRYFPHMPRALDSLTIHILPLENIGIVGRTGSGKSTIMGAVFRLFPLESGQIIFGGVDVSSLGLAFLRTRITIVPQDPVLFSGDLRRNLDPLSKHSDSTLLDTLKQCGLEEIVNKLEGGIHAAVAEGGTNFSVGEKQVLCLARALLRKARILCLDEATANVDPTNDARIQKVLSSDLENCISMIIAHRLHTVMNCDRILVLDAGKLAQFDKPQVLLSQPGIFQNLADKAGLRHAEASKESPPAEILEIAI
jgi:ABC-type multidrug transport system fused ATPase/permease subunit